MQSRLGTLMDNFGITGKDLSGLLHIDSSLVSKWRSGKRSLKANSVYTNQIIKHVMNLDRNNQYAKIRLMMSNDYINMFKATENEISLFLKDWLTSTGPDTEISKSSADDELKNLKNAANMSVYALPGNAGRRQAMQFLLKYAQHMTSPAELLFYTTESTDWADESTSFTEEWYMRLMSILGENGTLRIIHALNGSYEILANNILHWIPMHMTGRTEAYFIPRYRNEDLLYSYFIVKDNMAVYNWVPRKSSGRELNTYITHEPQVVRDMENMLYSCFDSGTEIFSRHYYTEGDKNIDVLLKNMENPARQYHNGECVPLFHISEGLMRTILERNGFSGAELDALIEKFSVIKDLGNRTPSSHFVQPEKLEKRLNADTVVINELSFACGRTIHAPHELYLRVIEEGMDAMSRLPHLRVCYASLPILTYLGDTEVLAKENASVSFSNTSADTPMALITNEMTSVTAIYRFLDELWSSVPYICRNKEYVIKQIQKQLDAAKAG